MRPIIEKKAALSDQYKQMFSDAKSILVFEYQGLSAKDLTILRRKLHNGGAKMYVLKNNIASRAFAGAGINEFNNITGPNAIIIANQDEIIPFKEVYELNKEHSFIKLKGGYLEKKFIPSEAIADLANIPSREGLYAMFLSCLQAPIRNFLYGIKAVGESKQ